MSVLNPRGRRRPNQLTRNGSATLLGPIFPRIPRNTRRTKWLYVPAGLGQRRRGTGTTARSGQRVFFAGGGVSAGLRGGSRGPRRGGSGRPGRRNRAAGPSCDGTRGNRGGGGSGLPRPAPPAGHRSPR